MYCPRCGAQLAEQAERCHNCDFAVRPVALLLRPEAQRGAAREQLWSQQRQSWGKLLIMCSLLIGCFIPIALGLFSGSPLLDSIILVLAGMFGVLLMLGSIFLLAAEREILVPPQPSSAQDAARPAPALVDLGPTDQIGYEEPAREPVSR